MSVIDKYEAIQFERWLFSRMRRTAKGCLVVEHRITEYGYARMWHRGIKKNVRAHVLSWLIHYGDIPCGLNVLHRCDVRNCVNPAHLFLGTHGDNVHDAMMKGRHVYGERCGRSKLKLRDITEIKKARVDGNTYAAIAGHYGVSGKAIERVCRGLTWKCHTKEEQQCPV